MNQELTHKYQSHRKHLIPIEFQKTKKMYRQRERFFVFILIVIIPATLIVISLECEMSKRIELMLKLCQYRWFPMRLSVNIRSHSRMWLLCGYCECVFFFCNWPVLFFTFTKNENKIRRKKTNQQQLRISLILLARSQNVCECVELRACDEND